MGGVRGEKNISTKGEKEKASARFPKQSFYAGRETRYKEKTGQRQEEIDGLKKMRQKKKVLCRSRQFQQVFAKGKFTAGQLLVYRLPNGLCCNRAGFVTGKKLGGAVVRNRARRLLRESYRAIEDQLPKGHDYVFVARASAVESNYHQITKEMELLFRKAGFLRRMASDSTAKEDC